MFSDILKSIDVIAAVLATHLDANKLLDITPLLETVSHGQNKKWMKLCQNTLEGYKLLDSAHLTCSFSRRPSLHRIL